ncbi:MAG: hypothetical protein PQJ61_09570 [Spirochaetales bacterium]|uniref:Uncharacterized protein n=1 Tax=Candidatus Thalassospirochaeta sargassi TaxID=3119039 RepID=A0AAJ1MNY2_9SPIO|nr:hypothetical protein [Spirochaetales bacterium]
MNIFEEIGEIFPELDVLSFLLPTTDDELLKKYSSTIDNYNNLKTLPVKFNEIFASNGWIATDDLSVPVMKESIEIYKKEGIGKAEDFLVNEFTEDYFYNNLRRMCAVWVFEDRKDLIELAYKDHSKERYHASVPVVLAQIDGIIHDIANQSFYELDKKLDIFKIDSAITGLKNELHTIAKKMNKTRNETKNSPLSFPYRNGIIHGRDLNYSNKYVSTKCFFNLFAIRPWALFIQQNEMKKRQGAEFIDIPKLKIGKKLDEKIEKLLKD